MFQSLFGLSPASLPRLAFTALLFGAGSSLLLGTPARAANGDGPLGPVVCTFLGNDLSCPWDNPELKTFDIGDKRFSQFDWQVVDGDTGTDPIFGDIEFKWDQVPPAGYQADSWSVDVDLNEGNGNVLGPANGIFAYRVDILSPDWRFATVTHDSNWISGATKVTKTVGGDFGTLTLISENGNPDGPRPIDGTSLLVRDEWSVEEGGTLDSFQNTFKQTNEVPAPLPLLGAGAAFGFSRRLRRRLSRSV